MNNPKIKGRCAHGRGAILHRVRPVIDSLFNINTGSQTVVRKNAETARKFIKNNAFYYVVSIELCLLLRRLADLDSLVDHPAWRHGETTFRGFNYATSAPVRILQWVQELCGTSSTQVQSHSS